ncbi:MAG: ABC transporter permease [Euryarchaeota archaeon]|nr:ABC transporter permease [Euryarchaeota archaeon]
MLDAETLDIVLLSLGVSGTATLLAGLAGVPLGLWIGLNRSVSARVLKAFTNALYALPPVAIGLIVYLALSRNGPVGAFGLLFTPAAMVIAQFILAMPLVVGITASAVRSVDAELLETAKSLGARGNAYLMTVVREARYGILASIMVAFGQSISEVGAVIMVGGNIRHQTRNLTTTIVLETQRGNFDLALLLGGILMGLALVIAAIVTFASEAEG